MKKEIITLFLIFVVAAAGAQKNQGKIIFSMKMENSPMAAMMGDMQITLYYKNGKSLTDMSSQAYSVKTLVNDSGSLTLMDAMGQKMFFKSPELAPGGPASKKPTIIYTAKTKEIAGYTCTKAFVLIPAGSAIDTAVFWYTEKLPFVAFGKEAALYTGLKGMPLEYEINLPQVKMTMRAKEVSTAAIPDSTFALSTEGYTQFDPGMLKQMQQQ